MEKFNANDKEAVEIRKKIKYLNSIGYNTKILDVISIEDVRKFESDNNIKLPDDYVWFITNVGNGGTWQNSNYHFWSLEEAYFSDEALPDWETGQENFSLDILSKGCSYSFGIILKGEHFGEISSNGDRMAFYNNGIKVHGFKELYTKWLNETCMGYDEYGFERRLSGTIEDNLQQYKNLHNIESLWSIFSKINTKVAYDEFISEVYQIFVSETKNKNKVLFTKILIKSGYKNVHNLLEKIFIPENYSQIIFELYVSMNYFEKYLYAEGVMENAEIYYPMLVEMLKHYEALDKSIDDINLKYCFEMTVMNPDYNENDIIDILTSDDKRIVNCLARFYQENMIKRIGKYIQEAKNKQ